MSVYRHHLFFCTTVRPEGHPKGCCAHKMPGDVIKRAWDKVQELNLEDVRINNSGCLGLCDRGPVAVVYPEGVWYSFKTLEDVDEIVASHLGKSVPVDRLKLG